MAKRETRYAYVPYNRGIRTVDDIPRDATTTVRRWHGGRGRKIERLELAGRVIKTTDGSVPCETRQESLDGRYAIQATRKQLEAFPGLRRQIQRISPADRFSYRKWHGREPEGLEM